MSEKRWVITQGEQAVSAEPDVVVSTLLGSCVSCCLWDSQAKIGGINHMLITHMDDSRAIANAVGVNAMELLINALLKSGARRSQMVAKVFGGAQMVKGLSGIGAANAAFTLDYLSRERVSCVSQSLGGRQARHVLFWPATGIVRQRFVQDAWNEVVPSVSAQAGRNDVELLAQVDRGHVGPRCAARG